MWTRPTGEASGWAEQTESGGEVRAETAEDVGVVTLVASPLVGTERTWNFTVSGSSFPSWAWR